MTKIGDVISIVLLAAGLALGCFRWRGAMSPAPTAPPTGVATARPPAPLPSHAGSAVRYLIELPLAASTPQGGTTLQATDPARQLKSASNESLGPTTVLQWVQLDGFARRLVATLDNLARTGGRQLP